MGGLSQCAHRPFLWPGLSGALWWLCGFSPSHMLVTSAASGPTLLAPLESAPLLLLHLAWVKENKEGHRLALVTSRITEQGTWLGEETRAAARPTALWALPGGVLVRVEVRAVVLGRRKGFSHREAERCQRTEDHGWPGSQFPSRGRRAVLSQGQGVRRDVSFNWPCLSRKRKVGSKLVE